MKLCLCFLVYDRIECETLWANWLKGQEKDVHIFIHSKFVPNLQTDFFRTHAKQIDTIPTKWGEYSLVEATLRLYEAGLETVQEDDARFILLSGNCIPVKKFQYVYNFLNADKRSFIYEFLKDQRFPRYYHLTKFFPRSIIAKHSQWIILTKEHVSLFLQTEYNIETYYRHIYIPDESWALTILNYYNQSDKVCNNISTTYFNWNNGSKNPKSYETITVKELKGILENPSYLFARKFFANTKIKEDGSSLNSILSTLLNS